MTNTFALARSEVAPCNLGFQLPAASSSTISSMNRFDLGRRSTNSTPIQFAPRNPTDLPRTRNDSSLTVKVSSKTVGRSNSGSGSCSSTSLHPFRLKSSIRAGHDFSIPRRWISARPSHSKRGCFLSSFMREAHLTPTSSTKTRVARTVSQSGTLTASSHPTYTSKNQDVPPPPPHPHPCAHQPLLRALHKRGSRRANARHASRQRPDLRPCKRGRHHPLGGHAARLRELSRLSHGARDLGRPALLPGPHDLWPLPHLRARPSLHRDPRRHSARRSDSFHDAVRLAWTPRRPSHPRTPHPQSHAPPLRSPQMPRRNR